MQRILEPELMTEPDQAEAYAHADFGEAHQSYVRLFGELFPSAPPVAEVLDLGCGPGDVTRRFARAHPSWTFDAVDGSAAMLAPFRAEMRGAPELASRITLIEGFLPDIALPTARYDIVLSSSLLHHLPAPMVLWQTIRACLRPGGCVLVTDLARPETAMQAEAIVAEYAAGEHPLLQHDFYHSLLAAFTPDEARHQLSEAGMDWLQVQAVGDRHLVVWGTHP